MIFFVLTLSLGVFVALVFTFSADIFQIISFLHADV